MNFRLEPVQSVVESLAFWAKATPHAIAFLSPEREPATYWELHQAVERFAAELRACGLGRQDGIALLLPAGPELCVALLAAMSVGIAIPLAWPNPESEFQRVLAHQRVRAVIALATMEPGPRDAIQSHLPVIRVTTGPSSQVGDFRIDGPSIGPPCPKTEPTADDIALILNSSGTTGRPKLVPRLHRAIVSTCRTYSDVRGITAADRCLSLAKLVHSQGVSALTTAIFAGASLVNFPGQDLAVLRELLHAYQPTFVTTTPALLRLLVTERGALLRALQQAPVRCIHSSAGPLSTDELDQLESTLGVPIVNGYGMSEAALIAGERYEGYQRMPGSVGEPWCEVQIVDECGPPVGPGSTGEIVIRGERVFPGYLDDAEANAMAFLPGGWFRTGDMGFLDDAGFLHITGRLSEMINRGGAKIAPVEVDRVLLDHPAVVDAAVFSVPDARLGEDIVAAVTMRLETTTSTRELRAWMLDRLSPYKVPRRIWMIDELPRTHTGKVQRAELARRWSKERT